MQTLYSVNRFSPALEIWFCESCGLQQNRTLPADLSTLYDEGYYTGTASYTYEDERKQEEANDIVWQARLRTIARSKPAPARFLDVGCSFGGFVAAAERAGYTATGLDLSAFAVKEGKKRGRNLIQGFVEPQTFAPESFDIVSLIEVMEHLPDPKEAARTLSGWLRPGGLAVIQTANFDGRQARRQGSNYHYYLPGHLYYYSARNLKNLLRQAGFSRFRLYRPVDFSLKAKLQKMRKQAEPESVSAGRLLRTSFYHIQGWISMKDFALTSSMVLYAFK